MNLFEIYVTAYKEAGEGLDYYKDWGDEYDPQYRKDLTESPDDFLRKARRKALIEELIRTRADRNLYYRKFQDLRDIFGTTLPVDSKNADPLERGPRTIDDMSRQQLLDAVKQVHSWTRHVGKP